MELLQFKYFCDAANTENFSVTAKKFNVPPSAVSQSIRRLESEIGASLFTRQSNKVALNARGAKFYKRIYAVLREIDVAVSEAGSNTYSETINICVNAHRASVKRALAKFQKLYPGVDIHIQNFHDPSSESFDFIIASDEIRQKGFKKERIVSENIAVAINKSNPFALRDDFDVSMLKTEPFIILQRPSSMYDLTHKVCAKFGFKPHIAIQTDDPSYIPEFLQLGLGVCIVAERSAINWHYNESVLIKPIAGYTRDTYVYISKKNTPQCAEKLVNTLIEEFKD
ncbi:MAG: LysR family transcriptional regulator [Clostridia bacterium]|nr:LysR family transcriptional regulator [Clostridia bacterium]